MKYNIKTLVTGLLFFTINKASKAQTGSPTPTTLVQQSDLLVTESTARVNNIITIHPQTSTTSQPGYIYRPASYIMTGQLDYLYAITLPKFCIINTGNKAIEAASFTSSPQLNGVLNKGAEQITIGATIKVSPSRTTEEATPCCRNLQIMVNYN